jgi:hypothetical protein
MTALPRCSDVDLLGHGECVIDFDAGECSSARIRAGRMSSVGAKRPQLHWKAGWADDAC